ncbi:MAG TPA: hypothetical protein VKH41_09095 [Myxococcota bacterium]|nr:hypothetical protein [Myxococcota bacterium]
MRSSRTWCAAELVLISLFAIAPARAAEWSVFAPPDGRFAVEFPGGPAVERDSHWTPVGSVAMTKYWRRVGDALLAVEMHELPPVAAALVSDDRILDQAREGVLRDTGGALLEGHALEVRGSPARDFTYQLPGEARLSERALAVLVGRRLYIVTGMARAPASDPAVARFFGSFQCWGEADPR